MKIIAEVKTQSPFGFKSDKSWDELFGVAEKAGDIISLHTDPRWGGSFDMIKKARARTRKPILAKGIHESDDDIRKAFDAGADLVLVVGRIPDLPNLQLEKCIIEPLSLTQMKELSKNTKADMKFLWNSRDLSTGGAKKETFRQARAAFSGWLCQASNIQTVKDIEQGADAVLVGTHLLEFAHSLPALYNENAAL